MLIQGIHAYPYNYLKQMMIMQIRVDKVYLLITIIVIPYTQSDTTFPTGTLKLHVFYLTRCEPFRLDIVTKYNSCR